MAEIKVVMIPIALLNRDGRFQPRFSDHFYDLVESVRQYGVREPVQLRADGKGRFDLVNGNRRTAAAEEVGLSEVPAIVENLPEAEARALAVTLQIQKPLSALEKLNAVLEVAPKGPVEEAAQRLGYSESTVKRARALGRADRQLLDALAQRKVTSAHAQVLLKARKQDLSRLIGRVEREGLSSTELKTVVKGKRRPLMEFAKQWIDVLARRIHFNLPDGELLRYIEVFERACDVLRRELRRRAASREGRVN